MHWVASFQNTKSLEDEMGITFKKQKKETGLRSVGYPYAAIDIKRDKKVIGMIDPPTWRKDGWHVRLAVRNEPGWGWLTLGKICGSEEEARELAKKAIPELASTYTFHELE